MSRRTLQGTEMTGLRENTTMFEDAAEAEHLRGRGWHGNPEGHAAAGRKGGRKVSQDRAHMAEIGRRGGSKVSEDRSHMADIGRRGGAKVSQDRDHMAEIGKKGGESR